MQPTPARMVLYTLRDSDVALIRQQRQRAEQATHVGNEVETGQEYPAMVVRVFDGATDGECNLQVFLDGSDTFWACSRKQAEESTPGGWRWPPRVPF